MDNQIADAFYVDMINRNLEKNTAKQYSKIVSRYLNMTGMKQFLKGAGYQKYKPFLTVFLEHTRAMKHSYSYTKTQFTAINNFFMYLIDEDFVDHNPVPQFRARYVRTYKAPEPAPKKQCTPAEIKLLVDTAPHLLWKTIILLYAVTGLRREELVSLNIGCIDFEKRIIHVPPHKKRTNCRVPVTDEVLGFILDYLEIRID
ncbi:tyrosine-type recombinase/integrase [Methanolapillus africanus]|uniref:tyrosine-type recombinase/integrase n=1 Tax=Methanolapillus africanus TaxID=3028297 RepID=UPI0030B8FD9C